MNLQLREATETDTRAIAGVIEAAFGGAEIADLVERLVGDPSAQPVLSLVATVDGAIVGHILFTDARIEPCKRPLRATLLAPLAVHPDYHGRGIGGRLIAEGLDRLRASGAELAFVLGSPRYYSKHGFSAAGSQGLDAPHPIPAADAEAWMVQELQPGVIGEVRGRVRCADAISDAKYWRG